MEDIVKMTEVLEEGKEYLLSEFRDDTGRYSNTPIHIKCIRSIKTAYLLKLKYRGKNRKGITKWYDKKCIRFAIQEHI